MDDRFYKKRIKEYKENRDNVLSGNINCIPSPFVRFRSEFPGIEQGKYYLVSGNEKSGKCFGKDTKVIMFNGDIKKVQDIITGDILMGHDSTPRIVKETHTGKAIMYEITQNKGGKIFTVNGEHILHLYRQHKVFNMSVKEYLSKSESFQKECCQMAKFPDKEVLYRNFTIKEIGEDHYYGFEVDKDHLFLLEDYTIVHNSQISDFLFMLHPLMYAFSNPDKLKLKILYFSLEMSKAEKYDQMTCFWLYMHSHGKIRIDTKILNSLNEESPLSSEVLELLESQEYSRFFDFMEDNVIFYESIGNPTGINKECIRFAESRGRYTYKNMDWQIRDPITGEQKVEKRQVIDEFIKDDKEEYWIVITDHLSLLSTEKGEDLRETIGRFSSNYCVRLRNIYKFTVVNIQQQSATAQDNESFKLDRLAPSPANLAENKSTKNDLNVMLGIFSPYRFKKAQWEGYDIRDFNDHIRFLEVVLNRSGSSGAVCPLYFDGAVNFFSELPVPTDERNLITYKQLAQIAQNNN